MGSEKTRQRKAREIRMVLGRLGISEESEAMEHMICAIRLAHEDAYLTRDMRNQFFPVLAKELGGISISLLERDLRYIRDKQWIEGDRGALCRMADFEFQIKPSTGEFIHLIRIYMEKHGLLEVFY